MRHVIIAGVITALAMLVLPGTSKAEVVRLRLDGTIAVGDSHNLLPAGITTGTDFVAWWSYDSALPNTASVAQSEMFGDAFGQYVHPLADPLHSPYGLSVRISGYTFRLDTSTEPYTVGVSVGRLLDPNVFPNGGGDAVGVNQPDVIVPFDYDTAHTIHDRITLLFSDGLFSTWADSSLESTKLPIIPDPNEFGQASIFINGASQVWVGRQPPPAYQIVATIEKVTLVSEPGNSAMLVLAIALGACCWSYRVSNRKCTGTINSTYNRFVSRTDIAFKT